MGNKTTIDFLMRYSLIITLLACMAMFSLQKNMYVDELGNAPIPRHLYQVRRFNLDTSEGRRIELTRKYWAARRNLIKMPAKMCVPLKKMGMYLIDLAVNCAAEAIIPGAGEITDAIKMAKKI